MSTAAAGAISDLLTAIANQHTCLEISDPNLVNELSQLGITSTGSRPAPLVLQNNRLFLYRLYRYEAEIAGDLVSRNTDLAGVELPPSLIQAFLDDQNEEQRIAALMAMTRQLTVLLGGPGTGKTSTVVRILGMIRELDQDDTIRIRLAAPTGKAAMRLAESISQTLPALPERVSSRIPSDVSTIHRLLGTRRDGRSFQYHRDNPLPVDFLVIDEVSMMGTVLMRHLLEALPAHTRLLLIGDPDQLPPVEAGNVLTEICRIEPAFSVDFAARVKDYLGIQVSASNDNTALSNACCRLQQSYRFPADSPIGYLAKSILEGEISGTSDSRRDSGIHPLDELRHGRATARLLECFTDYLTLVRTSGTKASELLACFDKSRVLCPLRDGDLGVESLNGLMENALAAQGIKTSQRFYPGRPVIINRNDYRLGLYNGDIGICVADDNDFRIAFPTAAGEIKYYLPSQLPPHETCFAMTVHKSQGSEFDHVVLIVPTPVTEASEQLLTRQLLYTAVTRARESLSIYTDADTWNRALTRSVDRKSGLADNLERTAATADETDR